MDVAGLVASTLRLNDNDFLASRYRFNALAGDHGTLRNEGSLRSSFGGQVVLLGPACGKHRHVCRPKAAAWCWPPRAAWSWWTPACRTWR